MIKFSIVVPTRNRSDALVMCLQSIAKLAYSNTNYELLIVDNGSTDDIKATVSKFKKLNPYISVKYFREEKIGPSYARNLGIRKARNPFIVCIDDDVIVQKNLLHKYSDILVKHPDTALIGGRVMATGEDSVKLNVYLKMLGKDSWVFSQTNRREKKLTQLDFPDDMIPANILINRKVVKGKVFNEKFGRLYGKTLVFSEDLVLCLNLLSEGEKVIYDPSIVSKHIIGVEKLNIQYILNRFFRAGVEKRLMDKELEDSRLSPYKFSLRLFVRLIKKLIFEPNMKNLVKLSKEVLFAAGYYTYPIKSK